MVFDSTYPLLTIGALLVGVAIYAYRINMQLKKS